MDEQQVTRYSIVPTWRGDKSPSLEPAKERVAHSGSRLNDLISVRSRLYALVAEQPLTIRLDKVRVDAGEWAPRELRWGKTRPEQVHLESQARMLCGEVIYHLRTALDYLAYHLVWLDRQRRYEGTQFPIIKDRSRWDQDRKRLLRGLNTAHVERLWKLQPAAGCEWTERLRRLSNVDKHRNVLRLSLASEATMPLDPLPVRPDPDDATKCLVDTEASARLTFGEGGDVYEGLLELCRHVADTLNDFSPDFGEPADLRLSVTHT